MNIYSGVPFTVGLFLMVVTWALVVSGLDEKAATKLYRLSLAFLVLACLTMPLGWFFPLHMYQGFFGLALAGLSLMAFLAAVQYRQKVAK